MAYNHNNSTMVKNINNTSSPRYTIPNLTQKYMAANGSKTEKCQAKGCSNPATATGHVMRTDGRSSNDWYLARICSTHNSSAYKDAYALAKNAKLVAVKDVRKK